MREPFSDKTRTGYIENGSIHLETEVALEDIALDSFRISPYGYLVGLEIEFDDIPNMNASNPLLVSVDIYPFKGEEIKVSGMKVTAKLKSVE
jgi:hypothetical protein